MIRIINGEYKGLNGSVVGIGRAYVRVKIEGQDREATIPRTDVVGAVRRKCTRCNSLKAEGVLATVLTNAGERQVCDRCLRNYYKKCTDCGKYHPADESKSVAGRTLCPHCFASQYYVCRTCGQPTLRRVYYVYGNPTAVNNPEANASSQIFEEHELCPTCGPTQMPRCSACGTYHRESALRSVGRGRYCQACYRERYANCCECNTVISRSQSRTFNGRAYCSNCFATRNVIREYSYRPTEYNYAKKPWENTLFMGVELEVQGDSNTRNKANEFVTAFDPEEKTLYLKRDGSIGNEGFEIVSHPRTLQAWDEVKLKDMLKWLDTNGFTSYESGECGLHVHMSRNFFTPAEIMKLRAFFAYCKPQLHKFSRRKTESSFAQFQSATGIRQTLKAQRRMRSIDPRAGQGTRYSAVNVTTNTVEIRYSGER